MFTSYQDWKQSFINSWDNNLVALIREFSGDVASLTEKVIKFGNPERKAELRAILQLAIDIIDGKIKPEG